MICYRTFRNSDPPKILDLWNRNATGRGFAIPAGCDNLEKTLFCKPFFDREGLHLAFDGDRLVGLSHAGFGCNESETQLDMTYGTICFLLVDEQCRRQGIGSELLRRGQQYLHERGVKVQYAGAMHPLNPFYLGLYGGSELPGILESNPEMTQFVIDNGYEPVDDCLVYQRNLDFVAEPEDKRLPLIRRQVEITVEPWPSLRSWWHACMMGQMTTLGYEIVERGTQKPIGKAWVWEMDNFERAWGGLAVGISDLTVVESHRHQGYGKLLLHTVMKHLHEQKVQKLEVQTMEDNIVARKLFESLGFEQVDTGHTYRYTGQVSSSPGTSTEPSERSTDDHLVKFGTVF